MTYAWFEWFLVTLGVFCAFETFALITGKPTLSRTVWRLTKAYPIFPLLFGTVVGGLVIHFFGWLPACVP